jgi:uncharacterized protein
VNLPVKDLTKSVDFFTRLGFEFNPAFTDQNATCMVVSEQACVMLLVEDFFKTFTKKDITDTVTHTEAILALSADSRQEVDELLGKAVAAGGQQLDTGQDEDFMYTRSFADLDGHLWELLWMDASAIEQ